jgi:superfamily I DNA and/or RNA helicase
LLAYTKVLGATNQQSISKNMNLIKNDDVMFDNVFIDEAATSSPLDLFIPMSVANKKIILVGDYKQLPNITDEGIIDEIQDGLNKNSDDSEDKDISSTMKKTLFEILIEKAHQLEAKDGRRRVIMLDTQFKMHPKLGEIVSNSFYEGVIKSVRPESEFIHNYHNLKDKYLYWLDTPYDEYYKNDYRERGSHSRKNVPEAKTIAKYI